MQELNYRVIERINTNISYCSIYLVTYKDGKVETWTEVGSPIGTDLENLRANMAQMQRAFALPVLTLNDGKLTEQSDDESLRHLKLRQQL